MSDVTLRKFFLLNQKIANLKKARKGKKRDQHCLQKFVSFGEQSYDAWEREGAGGREARVQLEESSCRGGRLGADSCGREMQKQKGWKERRTPVSDAFWALLDGSLLLTFDGFV